jgi:MFS family permease
VTRDFRLLLSGQAVSVVGDALFPVALAFAVLDELDGTPSQLGLVLAAQALPLAVLILAAGVWADRLPRRAVMVASDLGRAAVQAALAALLLTGEAELWHLVALVAVYGTFEAGFQPALGGLVPEVAGADRLQEANALLGLAQNLGMVAGPALAAVLIALVGPGGAIALDAATFLASAALLLTLRARPAAQPRDERSSFWADLRGGLAEVRARRWMWTFMPAFSAYHLLALPCVLALGPVIADRELGGATDWGIIVSAFGIGAIAGNGVALRLRPARPMLAVTLFFFGASCQPLIIAFAGSTPAIAGFELLAGIAVAAGFTLWDTTLGREIPARSLSRVSSLDWFTTAGTLPLGYALVAPASDILGTRATMAAASVTVMALLAAALIAGDVRRLESRPAARDELGL